MRRSYSRLNLRLLILSSKKVLINGIVDYLISALKSLGVGRCNDQQLLLGNADSKLSAHSVEGKTAFLVHPDLHAVPLSL